MTKITLATTVLFLCATGATWAETLTLQEAVAKSAASSHPLRLAVYDEQVANENVLISRSGYLPRVDFQGGYTVQQAPQSITVQQGSFETQQADYGFFSLSLYETLYDFGRTRARVARAKAARDAVVLDYSSQQQDVFLRTVAAYFRILQGQKLLKAADDEVAQMADHRRLAQVLFDQGVVTRNDLLQADVRLATSKQRRLDVANRVENAWLTLNDLIGQPLETRQELLEDATIYVAELEKPAEKAVAQRAEIRAQRKMVEASEEEVKESKSAFFPEIFTRLGVDYVQNDKVKEQAIMAATVGLKINLFDGLATTARHRQSVQNRSRNEERLRQLQSDLALEYRIAVNDAKVAIERIGTVQTSIRQGEENLRINRDRYQEQVGTATDVIDAQTLLTQIRSDYYQAVFDYEVALARVKRAKGEL